MNRSLSSLVAVVALVVPVALMPVTAFAEPGGRRHQAEAVRLVERADPGTRSSGRAKASGSIVSGGGVEVTLTERGDEKTVGDQVVTNGQGVDYVARVVDGGLQVAAVVRDARRSVQRYRFLGRYLEIAASGLVIVRAGGPTGEPVGLIEPAWAKDANGGRVPTRYSVAGDTLTQTTDITRGTALPVVADPRVRLAWYGGSVDFSRAETKAISRAGSACAVILGFANTIAGQLGVAPAVIVGALTAGCGAAGVLADVATDSGKCLSVKILAAAPGATAPWISKCYK